VSRPLQKIMKKKKADLENKEVREPKKREFSTKFTEALHKIGGLLTELSTGTHFSNRNPIRLCF
jgi:hypothetical protein